MSLVKKNVIMLLFVQGLNFLFPIITFPYYARVFGTTGIGQLALAQSVITFLLPFIDFGFNLTSTKAISIANENKNKDEISKVFYHTIILKLLIMLIVVILSFGVIYYIPQLFEIKYLIWIGFISFLGAVFNPIWLFQGLQRLSILLIPNLISKAFTLILVFVFIKSKSDIGLAMLLNSTVLIISAVISLFFIKKFSLVKKSKISFSYLKWHLKESSYIFLSYISTSLYTTLNTFLISFYVSTSQIGIYSSADKIIASTQSLFGPFQQAIFPNLSSCQNKDEYLRRLKKYGYILFIIGIGLSILLFLFSKQIVNIMFGIDFQESSKILKILSPLPSIISLAIIYGQWGLVVVGKSKLLSRIYFFAAFFHLSYIFIFISSYGIYGVACAIVITEFIMTCLLYIAFKISVKKWIRE